MIGTLGAPPEIPATSDKDETMILSQIAQQEQVARIKLLQEGIKTEFDDDLWRKLAQGNHD